MVNTLVVQIVQPVNQPVTRVRCMSSNVNNSGGLEQITPQNEIIPQERTEEDMYRDELEKLKDEMD